MLKTITVSQLNRYVKERLQEDDGLQMLSIRGEISNFTHHIKTGHFYFSLKDESCSVKAVMFRSDAQHTGFMPENGMKVIVYAYASLFERDGTFQVYATKLIPDGIGEMQVALEQLKAKLSAKGFFAQEAKKKLPAHPAVVGIVTSKTGAALQDILNVANRRCPTVRLLLAPVRVQGGQAATEIARAIRQLDEMGVCDVIIVARGGGSKEDLWVFHDERIAQAAFECKTPFVSAVGHEIDVSILDLVADLRAPTPSAAAELVFPNLAQRIQQMQKAVFLQRKRIDERLCFLQNKLYSMIRPANRNQIHRKYGAKKEKIDMQWKAIQKEISFQHEQARDNLAHLLHRAQSLNPYAVLARGYAVVTKNDTPIYDETQLAKDDQIEVQMHQTKLFCKIEQIQIQEESKWIKI